MTLNTLSVAWAGLIIADREGKQVPELADVRVRQAINHAIDREAIVEFILNGYGEPTSQLFVKNEAYDESLDDAYDFDVEQAKQLMKDAGADDVTITLPQWDGPVERPVPDHRRPAGRDRRHREVRPGAAGPGGRHRALRRLPRGLLPARVRERLAGHADVDHADGTVEHARRTGPRARPMLTTARDASGEEQAAAFQKINRWLVEEAWFAPFFRQEQIFGTTAETDTEMQAQNAVPSLWSFRPAE